MNGNKIVLDTNIIVFASKQLIDVEKLINSFDVFYVSIITFMEAYSYNFSNNNEKLLIDELFNNIEIIEVNKEIADLAINIRNNKNKKIKLPDAIILATSKYLNLPLLTDDWDDFQNIDSEISIQNMNNFKKL